MAEEILTMESLAGLKVVPVQQRSRYFNMLFYGEAGTGKTVLAGSASAVPQMSPVIMLDFEGGTESLRHTYPDVQTVRITTWKELQEVYDVLHSGRHPYKTVILDSLTEIQKFNMYAVMQDAVEKRPNQELDVPSMREWGINLEQIRRMVRGFRDLEMHTLFTALVREEKNNKTGLTHKQPSLSGKMAGEVAAFLDVVIYYYVKQVGTGEDAKFLRLGLTQKTDTEVAKDRSGKLPMVLQSPTMQMIYDLMVGKPESEPEQELNLSALTETGT